MEAIQKYFILFFLCLLSSLSAASFACTDVRLTSKDGTILVTRSMEYALDLQSNLRTSTRGRAYVSTTSNGKPGMSWKAKYGYVFLDALNQDIATDGMNEKGLAFEALYLPGLAQYQAIPAGSENKAIPYLYFGDWVLSNFDSVDQVREAIKNIYVFPQKLPNMDDMIFPLHYSIHDASGKSLVIEYTNGQLHVYDNKIGVFTNSPSYPWHLTNLENYLHLAPTNPKPVIAQGVTFAVLGQGFGMIGLPGDVSPPSRFVKMATYLKVALQPNNAEDALNLAEHIINNVDIFLGLAHDTANNTTTNELTQWVVFKDLTHRILYYRTYKNLNLRSVSLTNLNFDESSPRLKMPIASNPEIKNMTGEFLKNINTTT